MEIMLLIVLWIVFAIPVGVAADARGRNFFVWFLLSVLFSPFLSVLLLIAWPSLDCFKPEAAYRDVPYITLPGGAIVALMGGTRVQFPNLDTLHKTVDGGHALAQQMG
jgi:uncharacterized membrane protein YcfT